MITIHDKNFNILRANKAAREILKLPDMEVNKDIKCFGEDNPPADCPTCNCTDPRKPGVYELYQTHLNRFVEIRSMPRLDGNNQLVGLIHVVRDITKRKNDEKMIRTQLDRLSALRLIDRAISGSMTVY